MCKYKILLLTVTFFAFPKGYAEAQMVINPFPVQQKQVEVQQELVAAPESPIEENSEFHENGAEISSVPNEGVWQAEDGANIQKTLAQWSANAGVEVIWDSQDVFLVLAPVAMAGSYENAVQSLLDQYKNLESRPVADLYVDPQTHGRTLVVSTYKSGLPQVLSSAKGG